MKIYTSYFAKMKSLPDNVVPIAICGGLPKWYEGLSYKKLAPKYGFWKEWKDNHEKDEEYWKNYYILHYNQEVLSVLNPNVLYSDFLNLSGGKDVVLLCYEKPGDFCHRHLVAEWFSKYGYKTEEFVY